MVLIELISQVATDPLIDFILRLAQIISSSVVAITLYFTIKGYLKMRTTEQIKIAHDFFKDYRDLEKESAMLKEQGRVRDERMDWASRYFNTIEWFSLLVNTKQITNQRLIGFYEEIIISTYEKIVPFYYEDKKKEIEEGNLFPELTELYLNLKHGKIKVYHHKKSSQKGKG